MLLVTYKSLIATSFVTPGERVTSPMRADRKEWVFG